MQLLGKYLILGGIVLFLIGSVLYFFGNNLGWLGKLPGDIRIERDNFKIYVPITTMLLLSIVITILINLIRKFL